MFYLPEYTGLFNKYILRLITIDKKVKENLLFCLREQIMRVNKRGEYKKVNRWGL